MYVHQFLHLTNLFHSYRTEEDKKLCEGKNRGGCHGCRGPGKNHYRQKSITISGTHIGRGTWEMLNSLGRLKASTLKSL